MTAVGVPVVGVELSNTEPSQVPWYKSQGISSVDDLDTLAGQAALVYALAGSHGAYGIKSSADSLLPDGPRRLDLSREAASALAASFGPMHALPFLLAFAERRDPRPGGIAHCSPRAATRGSTIASASSHSPSGCSSWPRR